MVKLELLKNIKGIKDTSKARNASLDYILNIQKNLGLEARRDHFHNIINYLDQNNCKTLPLRSFLNEFYYNYDALSKSEVDFALSKEFIPLRDFLINNKRLNDQVNKLNEIERLIIINAKASVVTKDKIQEKKSLIAEKAALETEIKKYIRQSIEDKKIEFNGDIDILFTKLLRCFSKEVETSISKLYYYIDNIYYLEKILYELCDSKSLENIDPNLIEELNKKLCSKLIKLDKKIDIDLFKVPNVEKFLTQDELLHVRVGHRLNNINETIKFIESLLYDANQAVFQKMQRGDYSLTEVRKALDQCFARREANILQEIIIKQEKSLYTGFITEDLEYMKHGYEDLLELLDKKVKAIDQNEKDEIEGKINLQIAKLIEKLNTSEQEIGDKINLLQKRRSNNPALLKAEVKENDFAQPISQQEKKNISVKEKGLSRIRSKTTPPRRSNNPALLKVEVKEKENDFAQPISQQEKKNISVKEKGLSRIRSKTTPPTLESKIKGQEVENNFSIFNIFKKRRSNTMPPNPVSKASSYIYQGKEINLNHMDKILKNLIKDLGEINSVGIKEKYESFKRSYQDEKLKELIDEINVVRNIHQEFLEVFDKDWNSFVTSEQRDINKINAIFRIVIIPSLDDLDDLDVSDKNDIEAKLTLLQTLREQDENFTTTWDELINHINVKKFIDNNRTVFKKFDNEWKELFATQPNFEPLLKKATSEQVQSEESIKKTNTQDSADQSQFKTAERINLGEVRGDGSNYASMPTPLERHDEEVPKSIPEVDISQEDTRQSASSTHDDRKVGFTRIDGVMVGLHNAAQQERSKPEEYESIVLAPIKTSIRLDERQALFNSEEIVGLNNEVQLDEQGYASIPKFLKDASQIFNLEAESKKPNKPNKDEQVRGNVSLTQSEMHDSKEVGIDIEVPEKGKLRANTIASKPTSDHGVDRKRGRSVTLSSIISNLSEAFQSDKKEKKEKKLVELLKSDTRGIKTFEEAKNYYNDKFNNSKEEERYRHIKTIKEGEYDFITWRHPDHENDQTGLYDIIYKVNKQGDIVGVNAGAKVSALVPPIKEEQNKKKAKEGNERKRGFVLLEYIIHEDTSSALIKNCNNINNEKKFFKNIEVNGKSYKKATLKKEAKEIIKKIEKSIKQEVNAEAPNPQPGFSK